MDRQRDDTFNRFNVLESLVQEVYRLRYPQVMHLCRNLSWRRLMVQLKLLMKNKINQLVQMGWFRRKVVILLVGHIPMTLQISYLLPFMARKGYPITQKGSKAASTLGLQKKPFKKGISEKPTKSGRKIDQEKVKMMGETLVEARFVKPIEYHFSHSSK